MDWNGQGGTQRSQRPVPPATFPFADKEERLYWWDPGRRRWTQTRVIRDRAEAEEARGIGWTGNLLECEIAEWAPSEGIRLVENPASRQPSRFGGSDVRRCRCSESEKYKGGLPLPPFSQYGNCAACGLPRDQAPEPQGSAKVTFEEPTPRPTRRAEGTEGRSSGSSGSAARPEEAVLADCERAVGDSDGENLVISKEQLRDLISLVKGHSSSHTEFQRSWGTKERRLKPLSEQRRHARRLAPPSRRLSRNRTTSSPLR